MNTARAYRMNAPSVDEWMRPAMLSALAGHDVSDIYRRLQRIGFSQSRIAALTGQAQPEVSAIVNGRQVSAYNVLARITYGLHIPPCLIGLGFGSCGTGCQSHPQSLANELQFLDQLAEHGGGVSRAVRRTSGCTPRVGGRSRSGRGGRGWPGR
jgi:transcriptional regulator with XRE-family HTH domain